LAAVAKGNRALIPRDVPEPPTPPAIIVEDTPPPPPAWMSTPPVQPWAGWPTTWATPAWGNTHLDTLTDIAWACLDLNSSVMAAMPPYLVGAAPSLDASWMTNPDPDRYGCWEDFARQLFWDFQGCGEAIVYATARYGTGWPARFHLIPPALVDVELDEAGIRRYSLGGETLDRADVCHIRYQATTQDPHGHGPLEVGAGRVVAANLLARYLSNLLDAGAVPTTALVHPNDLTAEQSAALKQQWIEARMSSFGLPAVLSGGVDFRQLTLSPSELALTDLATMTEARIAILLRVPAYLVGLPQSSDSLVYNTAALTLDFHWRAHLRNLVRPVVGNLSNWALPAGTVVELNRDEYIKPGPLERAQTDQIWHGIEDDTGRVLSAGQIAERERFDTAAPSPTLTSGVLQ
jgi:Phage portal protein